MCHTCRQNNVDPEFEFLLHGEEEMFETNSWPPGATTLPHLAESAAVSNIPPLTGEDNAVPGYTCYVNIDIGYGTGSNGKSFHITTKTGIFVPASFTPAKPIDIVIYLHGFKSSYPGDSAAIDKYWDGRQFPFFALREEINNSKGNVIFVAPTLGPRSQAGTLTKKGGFDMYMNQVTAAINEYIMKKRGSSRFTPGNIILSAHSGGGLPMLRIATAVNNYANKIVECWGFDSMYQGVDEWTKWATGSKQRKLFVYFLGSTAGNATALKNNATRRGYTNIVVQPSSKGHYWVPKLHLKERVAALQQRSPQQDNGDVWVHEYNESEFGKSYYDALGETILSEIFHETGNAAPVPFKGTPFAPNPPAGSYWPLITSFDPVVHYNSTSGYVGNKTRSFGWSRDGGNRYHVAIDLYANFRDPVVACQDGKLMAHYKFCCKAKNPVTGAMEYPAQVSYSLLVDHGNLVINYGEVDKDLANGLKIGDTVKAGQIIAYIGKNPGGSSMLHLETFAAGTKQNIRWEGGNTAPKGILDPTQYLLQLKNYGLRATKQGQPTRPSTSTPFPTAPTASSKAVRLNEYYSNKLGWLKYQWDIETLLGFTNSSPIPELFAEAVAAWQQKNGFTSKNIDGIIGPITWKLMQQQLKITAAPVSTPPATSTTSSSGTSRETQLFVARIKAVLPTIEQYRGNIPLPFILGWIKVESDGKYGDEVTSTIALNERGFFQISIDESKAINADHKRITSDANYSIIAGTQLINYYVNIVKKQGFTEADEVFWKLVKFCHSAGLGSCLGIIRKMKAANVLPKTWEGFKQFVYNPANQVASINRFMQNPGRFISNVEKVFSSGSQLAAALGR